MSRFGELDSVVDGTGEETYSTMTDDLTSAPLYIDTVSTLVYQIPLRAPATGANGSKFRTYGRAGRRVVLAPPPPPWRR